MDTHTYDLAIVGAGALGTFHAWHALQKGLRVALFERDATPSQATVRNFGQVIPSGMALERWHDYAVYGSRLYQQIQQQTDITVRQQGATYLASDADEMTLLEELAVIMRERDYPGVLLTRAECQARLPHLRADYAIGGLLFPQEITVEPREMIGKLLGYMRQQQRLDFFPHTTIVAVEDSGQAVHLQDSRGQRYQAAQAIVCGGRDVQTLFPNVFEEAGVQICKLLMMQTVPMPQVKLPGSILTGRSIRRYESFRSCPSYAAIKQRETPDEVSDAGIHILFKQAVDGSIILGDSHAYARAGGEQSLGFAFDIEMDICQLIIREAKKIMDLPSWEMANYWAGYYAQYGSEVFEHSPTPRIHLATGIGGKGMTTSAGFAKYHLDRLIKM